MGGAYCTTSEGEHVHLVPSALDHAFIIPDSKQAEAFIKWCYNP